MKIIVNGAAYQCDARTLAELLTEHDYCEKVATARNGDFVPKGQRAATFLAEGDAIEILAPMQGG